MPARKAKPEVAWDLRRSALMYVMVRSFAHEYTANICLLTYTERSDTYKKHYRNGEERNPTQVVSFVLPILF
jgi:hypothetical protein